MYIFVNSQLGMSPGKLAAQASHAAVEGYQLSRADIVSAWYTGGHYKKLVMDGGDALSLMTIERYLRDRDFKTRLIIDEGRTEIAPFQATAVGVEIVDKDDPHVAATFGEFRLYNEPYAAMNEVLLRHLDKANEELRWRREMTSNPSIVPLAEQRRSLWGRLKERFHGGYYEYRSIHHPDCDEEY